MAHGICDKDRLAAMTRALCRDCCGMPDGPAEACGRCGEACQAHPEDAHMKECAEECRKCEKACREMLKQMGHAQASAK